MKMRTAAVVCFIVSVHSLFGQTAESQFQGLVAAMREDNIAFLSKQIDNGFNVNYASKEKKFTLLIFSAGLNKPEAAKLLLGRGAVIGYHPGDGVTATYTAAILGHFEVLEVLLKAGGDINGKDRDKCNPLYFSCKEDSLEMVKKLVDHGADINVRCAENECTPLIYAASWGRTDVVEYLLTKGADVNARGYNGVTAVIAICCNGYFGTELLQLLIKHQADVNLAYTNGLTALMCCLQMGPYDEHARILIDNGADLNARDGAGKSALEYVKKLSNDKSLIDYAVKKSAKK